MKEITICKVVKNKKGFKVWRIIRCDHCEEAEGEISTYCMPYKAKDCKLGSKFTTTFEMK